MDTSRSEAAADTAARGPSDDSRPCGPCWPSSSSPTSWTCSTRPSPTSRAPTIVRDLGGGELLVKWLGSSYALALGVLLVLGGRLGDRFGQRRLFLIGISGFTLASLACGLSMSPAMLVAARLCQGAFGALLIPQGIAIMTHTSRAR